MSLPTAASKRIAAERKAGRSLAAIADMLNEEQVPTAQGARQWWPSTVRSVLP
jgi:hypothetical protein